MGDIGEVLARLTDMVDARETDADYRREVTAHRAKHFEAVAALRDKKTSPLHPGFVVAWLNELVPKDALIAVDVGDHTFWFYKMFITDGQRTFLSANMASMAFAFPAALAASLHHRERPVFAVTGDGGFAMLMADFTTAVREKLPLKVIVFNDGRLKNIVKEQRIAGYPAFGTEFPNPDFASFATSAGGVGIRVAEPDALVPAVRRALATADKPTLVDVLVDGDVSSLPAGLALTTTDED